MKSPGEGINDFQGIAKDIAPAKLPPQFFQEDLGGDRTKRGSWQRRRGFIHTNVPKMTNPVTCLTGFHMPFSHGYMFVEGAVIRGAVDLGAQTDTSSLAGMLDFSQADQSAFL
tara:strand:+ start:195 stop:533 length:339 start_codon:yes stop_codon:yes gene_type:complete